MIIPGGRHQRPAARSWTDSRRSRQPGGIIIVGRDYLPESDLKLQEWANRYVAYLTANPEQFGLTEADLAELVATTPEFAQARADHDRARTTARGLCSAKKAKRATLAKQIRSMAARIQGHPNMTNQQRASLGLPKRGMSSPPPGPEGSRDKPVAGINISALLRHTLRIRNQNANDITKGKPEGVRAVEVWVKVGDPPADPEADMRYVNMSTRNTLAVPFPPGDGNKQAHYKMRWVYKDGKKGGWSDLQSATIAA